jgi:hypothetical protein
VIARKAIDVQPSLDMNFQTAFVDAMVFPNHRETYKPETD